MSGLVAKVKLLLVVAALIGLCPAAAQEPVRIACVGDSITEGNANPDHMVNSWPQILQRLLERDFPGKYQAANFGRSGATLLRNGSKPIWVQTVFGPSNEFQPHIVIINLGTNDAVTRNWEPHGAEFESDYRELIQHYQALDSKPTVWLSNLTPMYPNHPRTKECVPNRVVIEKTIEKLAAEFGLQIIDFKSPLLDQPKLHPDGLHPNTLGHELMALAAYQSLTGKQASPDASIRPQPVQGEGVGLITNGKADFNLGSWQQKTEWVQGTGAKKVLLSSHQIEDGDFHLRARLRMIGQKNSAAGFFLNDNFFGFEGAAGTAFRNGPAMKGLRMLHPAELLWPRDSWIDFEVIRNDSIVWFIVNDFTVEMAVIPGAITRFGFDPTRSEMQISDWNVVGNLSVRRAPHMDKRTVQTPWIDISNWYVELADESADLGYFEIVTNPSVEPALIQSPDGKTTLELSSLKDGESNSTARTSGDGGKTWSDPFELAASLTGQGHRASWLPDGSLMITFQDLHPSSPTVGDIVSWVGSFDDLLQQREGRFTCRLLEGEGKDVSLLYLRITLNAEKVLPFMRAKLPTRGYQLPIVDLDADVGRHVIVDREKGQYLGHVSTQLLEDGKTILAIYPKGHGRGPIVYKRSDDGGKTWSQRLPTPENWATSKEVPTIHRVIDPETGKKRLIIWSGLYPARLAVSEDDGAKWSELQPVGEWGGIVVMGFVERLKNGDYVAMFHDDGRFISEQNTRTSPPVFTLYQTISKDGGLTWSNPDVVWSGSDIHLCEPGCVRSPDGNTLAVLLRENSRTRNSYVIFSQDEAKTWSAPRELPASLTGDRHTTQYTDDGRLFITFRDTAHQSPTQDDWVAWVGTWDDIWYGRPGQYRVRIKDNKHRWDTTYPGLELLPDGTIVTTTYGHWDEGEQPYILSARFTMAELDAKAKLLPQKKMLFERGMNGCNTYRIPALVTTTQGTLIACSDARLQSGRDLPNNIHTVIRRSTDGGNTWGDLTPIFTPVAGEGTADPCLVVDRETGRIWCAITWSKDVGWYNSQPGYGADSFHNYLIYSDDDGVNWSEAMDITASVKAEEWISTWFSPGAGLQTQSGRLLIPYSAAHSRAQVYSYAVISDDHGKTWQRVGPMGADTNENMVSQLENGKLICNMRSTAGLNQRAISHSTDDGNSWSPLQHDPNLIEPVCQASTFTIPAAKTPDGREWLLFCNPAGKKRENLTIKVSFDGGKSWPLGRLIHAGPTAYSCMTSVDENAIGLLYECGESASYEGIRYAHIPLQWLMEGSK